MQPLKIKNLQKWVIHNFFTVADVNFFYYFWDEQSYLLRTQPSTVMYM
jgi:hypothetical protein